MEFVCIQINPRESACGDAVLSASRWWCVLAPWKACSLSSELSFALHCRGHRWGLRWGWGWRWWIAATPSWCAWLPYRKWRSTRCWCTSMAGRRCTTTGWTMTPQTSNRLAGAVAPGARCNLLLVSRPWLLAFPHLPMCACCQQFCFSGSFLPLRSLWFIPLDFVQSLSKREMMCVPQHYGDSDFYRWCGELYFTLIGASQRVEQ